MGQDDSPNSHVREEFIKETKSGIYSSVLEAMFSSECPFSSFLNHIYSGGVDLSPVLIADHRSRDSRMAEALTLGPINCGSVLCSLMPHQWKLAGLIAFQGQPDGYRSLGWPFDNAHAYSTTSSTAKGITAQQGGIFYYNELTTVTKMKLKPQQNQQTPLPPIILMISTSCRFYLLQYIQSGCRE
ncbi:hypothetical protein T02_8581 [Trichinella nativa]|uniref:Uncharacterized protein n=1 Tax=Trichinella nativa TaxID=6335 RepID=A0A0V1KYZ9_9BILA|nr:hypothetical protein T02_8581 [Trichinella nativa]